MTLARRIPIALAAAALVIVTAAQASFAQSLVPSSKVAVKKPALVVSEETDATTVMAGGTLLVSVTIRNVGEVPASQITVIDELPEGLTLVRGGASRYSQTFTDPLQPGNEIAITIPIEVAPDVTSATYQDEVTVTAASLDPITTHTAITVKEKKGEDTPATPPQSEGQVLGAETTLAETGAGPRDIAVLLAGALLIGGGLIGLGSVGRTALRRGSRT